MILELYILIEVLAIACFFISFFTKQEILWALSAVFSGALIIASLFVEKSAYIFNPATNSYVFSTVQINSTFMISINILFFMLSVILGILDIFDKYGISTNIMKKKRQ